MSECESYYGDFEFTHCGDSDQWCGDDDDISDESIEGSYENEGNNGQDDSDTGDEVGVRALAFDPNQLSNSEGLPVNGHDYLKLVQEERNRLPAIVTVQPPQSAKKSTQSSTIPMEVLHCGQEIETNQENCMPSQQSSFHPMDTSIQLESHLSSSSSSLWEDEDQLEDNPNSTIYSGIASRELREQIRLKSLGCTPLNMERKSKQSASAQSGSDPGRDLIHRGQILTNFIRLRSQIDNIRGHILSDPSENWIDGDEEEIKQQKCGKRALNRYNRRVSSLMKFMNLGHPPQISTLVHKSQGVIHGVLDEMADQCEKAPIYSTLHADWIYSLIALLREPIEPDICSTLRRLAKLCIIRRDSYERRTRTAPTNEMSYYQEESAECSKELVDAINDQEYYACLLIICIVRYHFGQADLK